MENSRNETGVVNVNDIELEQTQLNTVGPAVETERQLVTEAFSAPHEAQSPNKPVA